MNTNGYNYATLCFHPYIICSAFCSSKPTLRYSNNNSILKKCPTWANLEGHSAGCGIHGCKCCKTMSRKSRVISNTNHKSFATPRHSNCNTRNIIYLLECSKCTKRNQYVGQTQRSLSQRLGGHRAASRIKTNLPLYKHFITQHNHCFERDIKLTILEKTQRDMLTDRESHWIKTLDTVYPKGLNSRYE